MKNYIYIIKTIATTFVVAIIIYSCKSKLSQAESINLQDTPVQEVDNMSIIQTKNGLLQLRVYAPIMQKFNKDTLTFDYFPEGIEIFAYAEDGVLESTIKANHARHDSKPNNYDDIWMAYGNVVIKNIVKKQTMETDTIYWNRKDKEIYTNCYVRMYSPDAFMQGYGMKSDERAANAIILKPFNSYTVVVKDTTEVLVDSINFIGPILKTYHNK